MLIYEAGEALRFDEISIRAGLRGILNVMRHIGMLPALKIAKPCDAVCASTSWVRAPDSGIVTGKVEARAQRAKRSALAYSRSRSAMPKRPYRRRSTASSSAEVTCHSRTKAMRCSISALSQACRSGRPGRELRAVARYPTHSLEDDAHWTSITKDRNENGILSTNKNLYSTRRLVEAGEERGHEMPVINHKRCYMNITSHNPEHPLQRRSD